MKFLTPLRKVTLKKRYKRFLADVIDSEGREFTVYCPNTGSMKTCMAEGMAIYISHDTRGTRKYPHTWELSETAAGDLIAINTAMPNSIVGEAMKAGVVTELRGYTEFKPEIKIHAASRIDWLLRGIALPDCYVEVKNVTLKDGPFALFPDAVTERGQKHSRDLIALKAAGHRAVMFYLVNRTDCEHFKAADLIDPKYATGLKAAVAAGVEILVYRSAIDITGISVAQALPFTI